jgi:hypothetical protein
MDGLRRSIATLMLVVLPGTAVAAAPAVPTHVLTADYLGGYAGTHRVPYLAAAKWLSWAEVDANESIDIARAGIKTLNYLDPARVAQGDPIFSEDEAFYAHDCSGRRLRYDLRPGVRQYLTDPRSPKLARAIATHLSSYSRGTHIDAFFFDDVASLYGVDGSPCGYERGAWVDAFARLIESLKYPVIYSNLALGGTLTINRVSNAVGGMTEECYASDGRGAAGYTSGAEWIRNENIELAMARSHKLFFCYNNARTSAEAAYRERIFVLASFLLTYDPETSVLWEYFRTPSEFHVQPEAALVALDPIVTAPSNVDALRAAGGAYVREYARCALAGAVVGPCAVVVNPDTLVPRPFPLRGYRRTLELKGSGALDGGSATVSSLPPPADLSPLTAAVAFK